jgi:NTP pyrophosphatase (non-canonical NTP hydrolase)
MDKPDCTICESASGECAVSCMYEEKAKSEYRIRFNFANLQAEQYTWSQHNFPNQKQYQPVLGVVEEVGELAHHILKMEQGIRGEKTEHIKQMQDAIGDITIYLANVCNAYGFDYQKIMVDTWNIVKQRDWQKDKLKGINATDAIQDKPNCKDCINKCEDGMGCL